MHREGTARSSSAVAIEAGNDAAAALKREDPVDAASRRGF
jgi:hypothetical protein